MMFSAAQSVFVVMVLIRCGVDISGQRVARAACSMRYLDIPNGDFSVSTSASVVRYRCDFGYTLYGSQQIVCFGSKWSSDPPMCIANTCTETITATIGLRMSEEYNGALVKFRCDVNYVLVGANQLICDGTNWSDKVPTCTPQQPAMSCDFEKDLCGWFQHDKDEQDWVRHSGHTGTTRTGPSYDHTLGHDNDEGHYVYFETSSPARPGHQAILESPLYPQQYSSSYCFSFWYHLFGERSIGSLELFVKPDSKMDGVNGLTPLFSVDDNKGNEWFPANFTIPEQIEPFQIWIVATKDKSYRSDMAVDDVNLTVCSAPPSTPSLSSSTSRVSSTQSTGNVPISSNLPTTPLRSTPTSTRRPTTMLSTTRATTPSSTITYPPTPPTTSKPPTTKRPATTTKQPARQSTTQQTTTPMFKTSERGSTKHLTEPRPVITASSTVKDISSTTHSEIVHPDVQPDKQTSVNKEDSNSGYLMYALIGIGVVLFAGIIVGISFFFYRKRRPIYKQGPSLSSSNPLYSELANQDPIVKYESDNPYDTLTDIKY